MKRTKMSLRGADTRVRRRGNLNRISNSHCEIRKACGNLNRILAVALSLVMLLSALPLTVYAADTDAADTGAVTSGISGACTWTYDSISKKLTISGNGAMADYLFGKSPFDDISGIETLIVEDGVTHIGDNSFARLKQLSWATLPESLTSIGAGAFKLTNLTHIEVPYGVVRIGEEAFEECESLTSVVLPDTLTTIGQDCFMACSKLNELYLPESVINIPTGDSTIGFGEDYYIRDRVWYGVIRPGAILYTQENSEADKKYKALKPKVYFPANNPFSPYGNLTLSYQDPITVSYAANGGSGTMYPAKIVPTGTYYLRDCAFKAPADKRFSKWDKGAARARITLGSDTTVTAQWKINTYTLSFYPNGGSGEMNSVVVNPNSSYKLPACTFTAPENKSFQCWEINGVRYEVDDTITVTGDCSVGAVWSIALDTASSYVSNAAVGYHPDFTVRAKEESLYFVDTEAYPVTWYNWTDGKEMTASDTFEDGKDYYISFKLTPQDGCMFTDDTVFYTNNKQAVLNSAGRYGNLRVWYRFSSEPILVTDFRCTVTQPAAGEHPDYTVLSADPEKYTCTINYWSLNGTNLSASDTFTAGKYYKVDVTFTLNSGYKVGSNPSFKINGNRALTSATGLTPAAFASLQATAGSTVSGTETSYLSATDTVTIQLLQNDTVKYSTTTAGNTGSYSITGVASGTYTLRVSKTNHVTRDYDLTVSGNTTQDVKICPKGDVNMNGKVQSNDAMAAYKHAQGNNPANLITDPYALKCADVKGSNGKVQSNDAMEIYKQAQGKHTLW